MGRPPKAKPVVADNVEEDLNIEKNLNVEKDVKVKEENMNEVDLKKQIAEQKEQIERLSKLVELALQATPVVKDVSTKTEPVEEDIFTDVKIAQDEYIKVISLCPMQLNLSTQGRGAGKKFRFDKFGETKRILYSDLVDVMEAHANFLHNGFFYIADARVIRKHGLDDEYEKILTQEQMKKIMSGKSADAIDLFKSASETQKQFICTMLIEKIRDEEEISVDLNLVDAISRISGVNIQEKGVEAKFYSQKNSA